MVRFELQVEILNPKILKIWGKKIEAVDPAKIGGYAFEGDWVSKNNSKGELFGLAPEGTLILAVMETGTNRHRGTSFLLCKVKEGEEDTWMGFRNPNKAHVTSEAIREFKRILEHIAADLLHSAGSLAWIRALREHQGEGDVIIDEDIVYLAYLDILAFSDTYDLERYNDLREELLGGEEPC